ncbi:MAG: hypothetical protein M3Z18_03955 [Gemmatimonadota bacterium]|nr:hypothetical protein [Gemmatimonadota bacterium]
MNANEVMANRAQEILWKERGRYDIVHPNNHLNLSQSTTLVPLLGYETTTEIAKDALESGRGVYELVCERGLMTRDQLDRLLNPAAMTAPRRAE